MARTGPRASGVASRRQGTRPGPQPPAGCSHRLVSRTGNGDLKENSKLPGTFSGQQREELSGLLQGSLTPTGDAVLPAAPPLGVVADEQKDGKVPDEWPSGTCLTESRPPDGSAALWPGQLWVPEDNDEGTGWPTAYPDTVLYAPEAAPQHKRYLLQNSKSDANVVLDNHCETPSQST